MKLRILKIITVITIISGLIYFNGGLNFLSKPKTAYAVGDLTVNWGVPEGNPIFAVSNFAPGQTQTHSVSVTNNAPNSRPVGVRGVLTSDPKNLASVLDFVVKDNGTPVYGQGSSTGPKTLARFFSESAGMAGAPLSLLSPSGSTNYSFEVTFQNSAGNPFQNANLIFDLHIGVFFILPAACEGIEFSGSPIFGTAGNDHLQGTDKNDLIISFDGNDKIQSGNGRDCIITGNGNNKINSGNGGDVIITGNGNSEIHGGNSNDTIVAGDGNNKIYGNNGNDKITVGNGNNFVDGGNGDDVIMAGSGKNILNGGNGNDMITGGTQSKIDGGNGIDTCVGGLSKIRCEL